MSHLYRDTAVVLRTYKLGEADRIVVLLTAENGKVRAVAKGVRKTMSRFGARLEPMSHVRLLLYRGRELDIVSQAESVEPLSPMLVNLDRASQGMAVLEAADQLALEREPNEALYRMVIGALRTIADRQSPLVVSAFYWKLLAAEGLGPELDACVRCGEERIAGRLRRRRGRGAVPQLPFGSGAVRRGPGVAAGDPGRPPQRRPRRPRIPSHPRGRHARHEGPRTPPRTPPPRGRHVRTLTTAMSDDRPYGCHRSSRRQAPARSERLHLASTNADPLRRVAHRVVEMTAIELDLADPPHDPADRRGSSVPTIVPSDAVGSAVLGVEVDLERPLIGGIARSNRAGP